MTSFRHCLVLLILSMGLPAFPQAPPASQSQGKANLSSERLLQDAYGLSNELPAEDRVWLLAELTMPTAKWHPALTRPWAEEQFRLAQQLSPGDNRLATQKNAATAMSWIDPERALQMLSQCDSPIPRDDSFEDLRGLAARRIFRRYWKTSGMRGLGSLQRVADHIGETGEYPYSAMVPVIREVSRQNPAKGQSLISEALAFYQRGSRFQMTDEDFIAFVKNTRDLMFLGIPREALEAIVKNLTKDSGNNDNQNWRVRIYTSSGVAEFKARNAGLLFQVLPVIREVDPDWARRLVEQNHDLAQADAARGKILNQEGVVIYKNPDSSASAADLAAKEQWGLEMSRIEQIEKIATTDPDQALTLAMSIGDPGRQAMGMAYAAAGFGNKPDQARQMLNQSQQALSSLKEYGEKLDILVAIAQSAAALHDLTLARDAVAKGLDLGEQTYEDSRKQHPDWPAYSWDGLDDLQKLVEIGTKVGAAHVVGRILTIRDSILRAYLLVSAARGLDEDKVGRWREAFAG
jgi:hypothetical protein